MTGEDINHRENGVRKLGDPTGGAGAGENIETGDRDAVDRGPQSNADLMRRNPQEGGPRESADEGNSRERVDQTLDPQVDMTRHSALREASRLGTSDTYLVDQDMEDLDQREGQDGPDGRPSPLANADNPER